MEHLQEEFCLKRYSRQTAMEEMGIRGQRRLLDSGVLVIGAGGLGCPVLTVLAAAGVGRLGIADGDRVEENDLNRQFFYTPEDIGKSKAACAGEWISKFRPDCRVEVCRDYLEEGLLSRMSCGYDMVILAVDCVEVRMMANRVCARQGLALVDGAVDGFYGQVTAVLDKEDPCLACFNPEGKTPGRLSRSLASTTMIVGALEAQFAIKWLAGIPILGGHTLRYDGKQGTLEAVLVTKKENCSICGAYRGI